MKTSSLRWVCLMLLAPISWAQRVWALPFLTVPAPSEGYLQALGQRHTQLPDWEGQRLFQVRQWLPERVLVVVADDRTLFMRSDQVEPAWEVITPILEDWTATPPDVPNYPAGTWGPEAAEMLLAWDARRWLLPRFSDASRATPRSLPLDGQPEH